MKNIMIAIKVNKGFKVTKPRRDDNWRVPYWEYTKPTNINNRGELKPWKNITIRRALFLREFLSKKRIGTAIIWDTDE